MTSQPHLQRTVALQTRRDLRQTGMALSYRAAGDPGAPALVLMHGIGSHSLGYRLQLDGLSGRFHVVAWDAPGYGKSTEFAADRPAVDDYAGALVGLLDALAMRTCVLVGSSLGALIGAAVAAAYPERLRGLVLSAPATGFGRLPAAERDVFAEKRIADMARLGPAGLAKERAKLLVAPTAPPGIVAAAAEIVAATRPRGYAQAAHMLSSADIFALIPHVRTPTLVVVGSDDMITPAATMASKIHEALANSRIEILEGAGHMVKLEVPDRFNALIRGFAESLP